MQAKRLDQLEVATFHTLAFATREAAENGYGDLVGLGVSLADISLFVHAEPPGHRHPDAPPDRDIDVGGGACAAAQAGGSGGVLAGLGLLAIPGFGALLAVGPLAAVLAGAITGGALGGFTGSVAGAGVCDASALVAQRHLEAGRAIVVLADAAWNERISVAAYRLPALIFVDHA